MTSRTRFDLKSFLRIPKALREFDDLFPNTIGERPASLRRERLTLGSASSVVCATWSG